MSSSFKSGAGSHLKPAGQGGPEKMSTLWSLSGYKGLNGELHSGSDTSIELRVCVRSVSLLARCPQSPVLWPCDQKRAPLFLW